MVDVHFHLSWSARSKIDLNLKECKTPEDVFEKVREEAEKGGTYGGWIVGTLLPLWLGKKIDRKLLDEASPKIPVSIATRDGHMAIANTVALEKGGIKCGMDGVECVNGQPTGRLYEEAMRVLRRVMPDPEPSKLFTAFKEVLDELWEGGVRQIHTMSSRWLEMEIVKKIGHKLQVFPYVRPESLVEGVTGVKLFADGVIVHGTAKTGGRGKLYLSEEELVGWLKRGKEEGFQVAVHVMGDEALDFVLDCFEKAGRPKKVLRIEHAALVRDDQLERLSRLNVPVTVQPGIMEAVGVEEFKNILGDKWRIFMRVKDFLDYGIRVYGGSDHPVGPWRLEEIVKYYKQLWKPPSEEEIVEIHSKGWELVGVKPEG